MSIVFRQRAWPYPQTVSSLPASVLVMFSARSDRAVAARVTYTIRERGPVVFWNQANPLQAVFSLSLEKDIELPVEHRLAFEWSGPPRATAMTLLIALEDGVSRDTDHVEIAFNGPRMAAMRWLEPPVESLMSRRDAALPRARTGSLSPVTARASRRRQ